MQELTYDGENIKLTSIVEVDVLKQILLSFSKATGLRAYIVDTEGNMLVTSRKKRQRYCDFCQLIRSSEEGVCKCKRSYAQAAHEAGKYGKPYIFRCHAGLIVWAAPIVAEKQCLGAIVCGQVLMWEPEDFFWEEIEEMTRGLNLDITRLIEAAKKLEVLSGERVQAAADLLFLVANHVTKTAMVTLQQQKVISDQQARLGEEIQSRKILEEALRKVNHLTSRGYPLEKEQELTCRVRKGDEAGAYRLLNEILAQIVADYGEDTREIKARILEIVVVLSRASAEGGAKLKDLMSLNSLFVEEFATLRTTEEMCRWLIDVTGKFIKCIREGRAAHNSQAVQKAVDFIRDNYQQKITLEDVSRAVYLSPSHLGNIFKQELGCTVMEFVTKVRIEEAKNLLRDPRYNVIQAAYALGFKDPGYFTKVFKRNEGITPSEYRTKAY